MTNAPAGVPVDRPMPIAASANPVLDRQADRILQQGGRMAVELEKAMPVGLRSLGLNERWLQDQIAADPSILGLGSLEIAGREHPQPVGGRIDFLMRDEEEKTFYEVEIMLGALDESHIIRTIEYWDIERQRRPQWEHRAVIVAEQITARFFNVLRLLNRAVPLIAIKLSTFQIGGKIVLHPVTVLNIIEESVDPDAVDPIEHKDRAFWERTKPATLIVVDQFAAALRNNGIAPRLTYNRSHVALGTSGNNFCWFSPRSAGKCRIKMRLTPETRDPAVQTLQDGNIDASVRDTDHISLTVSSDHLNEVVPTVMAVLNQAEELSR